MPRRVSLPGASELFRPTQPEPGERAPKAVDDPAGEPASDLARGSGRVRHEEKITVYVSRDELLGLEQARLTLRAEHARAVDRGRIVREAVAWVLEDFERHGPESELLRRLSAS